jgi:hypothetical protein
MLAERAPLRRYASGESAGAVPRERLRIRLALPRVTRPDPPDGVRAVLPLRPSERGGSGSFLVTADDERRYWCKVLNNPQGAMVPVNEQLVGRLGRLVGVSTCEVSLVEITEDLVGWEFRAGSSLVTGWAHGSVAVNGAVETHALDHRASNDNARRHAGFFALFDWLAGSDPQWLIAGAEDNAYYSHDHGCYLQGPAWTIESLQQHVGGAFQLGGQSGGLDMTELERLASGVSAVTEKEVVGAVANMPLEWPVTDEALEAFVDFTLERRGAVAERLRAMMGTA